jgi:hypothetical protein
VASSTNDPQYIDEHHQRICEFAADYLDEEDREAFVDGLLEKHGYERQTHWAPPKEPSKRPPGGQKRPGFYGGGKR